MPQIPATYFIFLDNVYNRTFAKFLNAQLSFAKKK